MKKPLALVLLEEVIKPKYSLGYTRDQMPQIEGKDIPEFLRWISNEAGETYNTVEYKATMLKPSQAELDTDKARKINDEDSAHDYPIIISNDDYVLDGHHRWLAVIQHEEGGSIRCHKLSLNAEEALELMHDFDKTTKRDIEDALVENMSKEIIRIVAESFGSK